MFFSSWWIQRSSGRSMFLLNEALRKRFLSLFLTTSSRSHSQPWTSWSCDGCFVCSTSTWDQSHVVYYLYKESLIIANFLGGLYLAVESRNRQIEIALYSINKTTETVYNMMIRRYPKARLPHGEVLLFAVSMAVMCYYYFNSKELFRPAY